MRSDEAARMVRETLELLRMTADDVEGSADRLGEMVRSEIVTLPEGRDRSFLAALIVAHRIAVVAAGVLRELAPDEPDYLTEFGDGVAFGEIVMRLMETDSGPAT